MGAGKRVAGARNVARGWSSVNGRQLNLNIRDGVGCLVKPFQHSGTVSYIRDSDRHVDGFHVESVGGEGSSNAIRGGLAADTENVSTQPVDVLYIDDDSRGHSPHGTGGYSLMFGVLEDEHDRSQARPCRGQW
jgi:hypothetical protein